MFQTASQINGSLLRSNHGLKLAGSMKGFALTNCVLLTFNIRKTRKTRRLGLALEIGLH
jgi:hypothetical protein